MYATNSDGTQDTSLRMAKDRARRRGYRVGRLILSAGLLKMRIFKRSRVRRSSP